MSYSSGFGSYRPSIASSTKAVARACAGSWVPLDACCKFRFVPSRPSNNPCNVMSHRKPKRTHTTWTQRRAQEKETLGKSVIRAEGRLATMPPRATVSFSMAGRYRDLPYRLLVNKCKAESYLERRQQEHEAKQCAKTAKNGI